MGFKQIRTSDLSDEVLDDAAVVTVVVKSHPDLQESKVLDASPEELKGLQPIENLVELELRAPAAPPARSSSPRRTSQPWCRTRS